MYNLLLKIIYLLSYIPFIYPTKYQQWFCEQKKIFKNLKKNTQKTIWVHCSSLGEYESIKPLITELKKINTNINITFFSTSGYRHFQDFQLVNQVSYLPIDLYSEMNLFIKYINPQLVIVAKNDIWPNMIRILKKREIPTYLVGCQFHKKKLKNWLTQKYYKRYLPCFTHIFCQDPITYNYIKHNNICKASKIGNTRINQILNDSEKNFQCKKIENFIKNKKVIIYGSIEQSDYGVITNTIQEKNNIQHIIVPHEINTTIIQNLQNQIVNESILYSQLSNKSVISQNILIVDQFGILKHIYKYSQVSYIGGGFQNGIHNLLEAAIHGNFILFGPKYHHFPEAIFFLKKKTAFSIKNQMEFEKKLHLCLRSNQSIKSILETCLLYMKNNKQHLQYIIDVIQTSNSDK